MQTLGLSNATPRTEGRLKSLFWPSIRNSSDVDYLGVQGYWLCGIVAIVAFLSWLAAGQPVLGVFVLLFYYLGGVGVRERSRYAAAAVFLIYLIDMAVGAGLIRVIIAGVLFSNLRATWVAAGWNPESNEAIRPPRMEDSWSDRFTDKLPPWLWPKVRVLFYVLSIVFTLLSVVGAVAHFKNR